jgi:hypothetical protein
VLDVVAILYVIVFVLVVDIVVFPLASSLFVVVAVKLAYSCQSRRSSAAYFTSQSRVVLMWDVGNDTDNVEGLLPHCCRLTAALRQLYENTGDHYTFLFK